MTDAQARILALSHAIQTGVAFEMESIATASATTPKHLRTGVNLALVETGVLAKILIDKGIITLEEYQAALVAGLEAEVKKYESRLSETYGRPVKLG